MFDPIDMPGIDDELARLGTVTGVVVLLDRHMRDSVEVAARHEVPLHVLVGRIRQWVPADAIRYDADIEGCPFRFLVVQQRDGIWIERAAWWPERRLLIVAEAVGNAEYFLVHATDSLGVHPLLRLQPPKTLVGLDPELLLPGHGTPVHDAGEALDQVLGRSVRDMPAFIARFPGLTRSWRRAQREGRAGC